MQALNLRSVSIAFKTGKGLPDGCAASIFLIVNTQGADIVYKELGELHPDNCGDKSHANFFHFPLSTDKENMIDATTYFRLAVGTQKGIIWDSRDSWAPNLVMTWGCDENGKVSLLTFNANIGKNISETSTSCVSIPLSLHSAAPLSTLDLLTEFILVTRSADGTWDPISFSIETADPTEPKLASAALNDPDQFDTTTGVTNIYPVQISRPFSVERLHGSSFVVRIEDGGVDRWEPEFLFLFGISRKQNQLNGLAIVADYSWTHGGLSNDDSEGRQEVGIPISLPATCGDVL